MENTNNLLEQYKDVNFVENVCLRMMSTESFKKVYGEVMDFMVYREMWDITMYLTVMLDYSEMEEQVIWTIFPKQMIEDKGLIEDGLFIKAIKNLEKMFSIKAIKLNDFINKEDARTDKAYIITNKILTGGAGLIFTENFVNTLKDVGMFETYDTAYCVPSSVNEWIVFPKSRDSDVEFLTDMIKAVNKNKELIPMEQLLSNNLYTINKQGQFKIAS